jgi:transposase
MLVSTNSKREASMSEVSVIGIDFAKQVFQLHGMGSDGSVLFRKRLSRSQVLAFLEKQPRCMVALEACATAHDWGRRIGELGHEVMLIPPVYVKPFVKRQKNDMADAQAIAEAAARPTMTKVSVKTKDQQARAVLFRTRDLLVRQRTQSINALRGHLAEYGIVAPRAKAKLRRLDQALSEPDNGVPALVVEIGQTYLDQIAGLTEQIASLEARLHAEAARDTAARRAQTMPGVGPVSAMAIVAFAPPMETFHRGRDFAAWLGLVPKQHSTGGKPWLGRTSKMGQRDIRRLLIIGAMAVIRAAARKGLPEGSWLARQLDRKPRMVAAVALADRMARRLWAMLVKDEDYREPVHAA